MKSDIEIPQGKRTKFYRFFEILPAFLSYSAVILMVVLSIFSPLWASIYLLLIISTLLVKAFGIGYRTLFGYKKLVKAINVDWNVRLLSLENPKKSYEELRNEDFSLKTEFEIDKHRQNLCRIAAHENEFPKPSEIINAVIIAAYNEPYEVIEPTIQSVLRTTYSNDSLVVFLAYEERGGAEIEKTAHRLKKEFGDKFKDFEIVKHPRDLPNEVVGKGGNITYAGKKLAEYCKKHEIPFENVLVTTLDSDNKPHAEYFSAATYEFIVNRERKHLSYQPVSLFLNNIWDAPAPMRVLATGNSFWNIIVAMRPHLLRNFASHSQPLDALVEMNFWSTRTIVEDGHQFWRSYFHFEGKYAVVPIMIPIYQDAVLSETLPKTLKAQFVQLRRWMYGASDVPYVASHLFTKDRKVPFWDALAKFWRLLEGHVSMVYQAPLTAFGGWIPLLINTSASRSLVAHQLPNIISYIQQIAVFGLFITIFVSLKMLPPKPERYKRRRTLFMVLQWLLMPFTSLFYGSAAAAYSQWRLASGRYLDKFDVTQKGTIADIERAKLSKRRKKQRK
ncbi:MAG: glycosyltransferase family 2 protein [bacterium]|nr:glycosyltransferase family 2 protein [bacterium]